MTSPSALDYRVLTVTRPGLSRNLPPGYEPLMWVANSATLIYGERDAVLVDSRDASTVHDGSDLQAGRPGRLGEGQLGDRPLGRSRHGGLLRRQVGGEDVVELRGIDRELGAVAG